MSQYIARAYPTAAAALSVPLPPPVIVCVLCLLLSLKGISLDLSFIYFSIYSTEHKIMSQEVDHSTEQGASKKPQEERKYLGIFRIEQLTLLTVYPLTVVLGQLVYLTDPYPSYFGEKKNIFNVLFVRQGWLWTTIAYVAHATYVYQHSNGTNNNKQSLLKQFLLRYTLATLWWISFSQWLFGLPIMDRVFVLTGGSCEGVPNGDGSAATLTSADCKTQGGRWVGGYDPSGHCFLLVHSSLLLWFEILPTLKSNDYSVSPIPGVIKGVFALLGLWWWMLLMTSVYFHSFVEKLAGLIWGLIEVTVVYIILPNTTQQAKDLLGVTE